VTSSYIANMAAGLGWRASDVICMVWAYYDESGEYKDGKLIRMSVGACVARLSDWESFEPSWRAILDREGLASFHMADFEAWKGPFDFKLPDGARDNDKHRRVLNDLLKVMGDHIGSFGGFACDTEWVSEDQSEAHRRTLEECFHSAALHAIREMWDRYGSPINLVFDRQNHFGLSKIQEYFVHYNGTLGRIGSLTMDEAIKRPPLQASDILAYEMSKIQRIERTERYPFRVLQERCVNGGANLTLTWRNVDKLIDREENQRKLSMSSSSAP
jgi:hypothetical protein